LVRTSPGRSDITKLNFSRFSSVYPKCTLYFNVRKSPHIPASCSNARTSVVRSANNECTQINPMPVCTQLYTAPVTSDVASNSCYFSRCVQLTLLPKLRPAPVTSDASSDYFRRSSSSCYFRLCVHLRLLPTLGPTLVTSDVESIHCPQNSASVAVL
jgi:hypothetical protein